VSRWPRRRTGPLRALPPALALVAAVALSACGGGDDGEPTGDEAQIREVLTSYLEDTGNPDNCTRITSDALDRRYGGRGRAAALANCRRSIETTLDWRDVEVTGIRIAGDTARATATGDVQADGGTERRTQEETLRREDGEWRLTGLGQPAGPSQVTGVIAGDRVSVSPERVGRGPVVLIVSNQTRATYAVSVEGPRVDERTTPIRPQGTGTIQTFLERGASYRVAAEAPSGGAPSGIAPATIEVR
jgi:hypothetical protein